MTIAVGPVVSRSWGILEQLSFRVNVALGLASVVLGLSIGGGNAWAAARRPPPPGEKKDPNVTSLAAKVLASKKMKEAMKESIAALREKRKVIQKPSQEPSPEEPSSQ